VAVSLACREGTAVDGFRVVTKDGRLAITEPWSAQLIEWGALGLWVLAMATLLAAARENVDSPFAVIAFGLLAALPLYLLGVGRHPCFVFDHNTHRLLRGRSTVCEESAIETIDVEESSGESGCYRVLVLCRDGRRHEIGEYASHQAALHLAERIHDHTGLPVRVDQV
jgi:hypothetical protein